MNLIVFIAISFQLRFVWKPRRGPLFASDGGSEGRTKENCKLPARGSQAPQLRTRLLLRPGRRVEVSAARAYQDRRNPRGGPVFNSFPFFPPNCKFGGNSRGASGGKAYITPRGLARHGFSTSSLVTAL